MQIQLIVCLLQAVLNRSNPGSLHVRMNMYAYFGRKGKVHSKWYGRGPGLPPKEMLVCLYPNTSIHQW